MNAIFATARTKNVAARQTIFAEGDPVQQVLLMISGTAKVSQVGENGSETILCLIAPGELLGALGWFAGGKHFSTAQSLQACTALSWDVAVFQRLLDRIPTLERNVSIILEARLQELEQRFREIATQRVPARLARALTRLMEQIGRDVNGAVEIGLTREELAQMTGTTLFTVSRILSEWEQRGIVDSGRGFVLVRDAQALTRLFEGPGPSCDA